MTWDMLPNSAEAITRPLIEEKSNRPVEEEDEKQIHLEQINLTNTNQHNMLKLTLTSIKRKITDGMMKAK